jgi:CRISPR-associated protein Cas1
MERIVDVATDGRHLSAYRGFLVVSEGKVEVGRIPLDDIAAVIVHAHGITWTTSLIAALAERGAPVVLCASNHAPVAVCLPLEGHHAQNARLRAQWDAPKPLQKQLWKQVVVAKIRWQGAVLAAFDKEAGAFDTLARNVGSGDPDNVEAQAARRYWPLMMGTEFRRDRGADGANAMLNYGYAVLRSLAARAVVAVGLHPSIGIHHANRANAFALADDLMEPFRPLVDALTVHLLAGGATEVTPDVKRVFAKLIAFDLEENVQTTTASMATTRFAQSLAAAFVSCKATDFSAPSAPKRENIMALRLLAA